MTDRTHDTGAARKAPRNPYAGVYPGNLFMVVAPSGAGKSTLVNALLAKDPAIRLSISYTTRPPRPKELDGQHYHFTTVEDFLARHARGEFLESAEVHGHYYATSRVWIEEQMKSGHDVLLEIDWQGAQQVKKQFRNAVEIFILCAVACGSVLLCYPLTRSAWTVLVYLSGGIERPRLRTIQGGKKSA